MQPTSQWRQTARRLMNERGLSVPKLADAIGEPERTVRGWFKGSHGPRGEWRIVERVAAALRVPGWWLHEPVGTRPPEPGVPADAIKMFPVHLRRVVLALYDPDALAYLLRMLDEYDRLRRTTSPETVPATSKRRRSAPRHPHA